MLGMNAASNNAVTGDLGGNLTGVDHVVICVHDLDVAQATYARLGFTLTPRGVHSVGTENHCIMLGADYIELVAVPRLHRTTQFYADFLKVGEGLAALALASPSAVHARDQIIAAGFGVTAPTDLTRSVEVDGMSATAAFGLTYLHDGQTPGARTFVCEHRTRELVWRPAFAQHVNGALGLSEITIVDEAPAAAMAPYARLFGPQYAHGEAAVRPAAGAMLQAARAQQLAARFPNLWISARPDPAVAILSVQVGDPGALTALLSANGFTPIPLPNGAIAVNALEAHGIALVFHS